MAPLMNIKIEDHSNSSSTSVGVLKTASNHDGKKPITVKAPRSVRFSANVETYPVVIAISDLSVEEITETWYTKKDFSNLKKSFSPTVKKMAKNIPLDAEEEARGLEHRTPEGMKKRQKNKFLSIDTVLDEQERQWESNKRDAVYLSQVYMQSSLHCLKEAQAIAVLDERFVNDHVRNESSSALSESQNSELPLESICSLSSPLPEIEEFHQSCSSIQSHAMMSIGENSSSRLIRSEAA